jgi:hypothetical protein
MGWVIGLVAFRPEEISVVFPDFPESSTCACLVLSLAQQETTATGRLGKLKKLALSPAYAHRSRNR